MLTSALQKSNSQTLKLYHKTPAAVTVSNATAAGMKRYMHAQQQRIQQQQQQVAGGRSGMPVVAATVAAAAAGGAAGLDELQLLLVRQRLAAVVAWRDAAARAGGCCVALCYMHVSFAACMHVSMLSLCCLRQPAPCNNVHAFQALHVAAAAAVAATVSRQMTKGLSTFCQMQHCLSLSTSRPPQLISY